MGLGKIAEKLDKYFDRLEHGKATKIKSGHVRKVIAKLHAKQELLLAEYHEAEKPSKKERIDNKLSTIHEQIERAEWLLARIGN